MTKDEHIAKLRQALTEIRMLIQDGAIEPEPDAALVISRVANVARITLSLPSSSEPPPPAVSITDEMVERVACAIFDKAHGPEAIYERAKDYAVYDPRGVLIATIPRNPYVDQSTTRERARLVGNALAGVPK